jgi:3-methyl-2-oxobutanoate hydroxymethyltransferase
MQDQNKRPRALTIRDLVQAKQDNRPISMVTAYDWWSGCLVDSAGVDCVLVGDSLAMVIAGKPTTLSATIEQMIYHGEIVARAAQRAIVFVDLPFPLQHLGVDKAIESAARILQETGCQAIKLEGTSGQRDVIAGIVEAGIPVMAHVGLRPQAVHQLGGYRIQRDRNQLLADATAAASAGACGVVLECVPSEIAAEITTAISIPTIGIGAGPNCDGQVLVLHDLIGLSVDRIPRFVRSYADTKGTVVDAVTSWRQDVEAKTFPSESETLA